MQCENWTHGYEHSDMEWWTRLSIFVLVSTTSYFSLSDKDLKLNSILRRLYGYSTASTIDAAYIIGGDETRHVIAEFKNDAWRQLGNLVKGRDSHASISLNGETMSIGGYTYPIRWIITLDFISFLILYLVIWKPKSGISPTKTTK